MRKQIKAHPRITILILFLIALAVTILIGGYRDQWAWTGFTGEKETYKTLYDWLQLLIIPVVIAVAGYAINLTISRSEQETTERRANTDRYLAQSNADVEREIAYESQQNEAVKSYIDDISQLILHDDLLEVLDTKNPARLIARIRTLTMLARLDSIRKRTVLHFLSESSLLLIYNGNSIVDLYGANLFEADLQSINLRCQNLKGVYLDGANLQDAVLKNCNLRGAHISETNLKRADLREALLYYSDLTYSDLRDADLAGAIVTDEQLAKVKSLKGARMRDRTRNP